MRLLILPNRNLALYLMLLSLFIGGLATFTLHAQNRSHSSIQNPEPDPRQSITYWKAHTLSAKDDALVAQTHDIFSVLLRAWDSSRLEPGLYVVNSNLGPWAASLADGNILLSRHAIEVCMQFGQKRGPHLLAFVLAHELAHQRAEHLWHKRFFRMLDSHSTADQKHMMRGLNMDINQLQQLEQKEAQADHDSLVLMSSVGYDPHQVLDKKDFFTEWVENIWQSPCSETQQDKTHRSHASVSKACSQAKSRALRTRLQLDTVASQSMLYQMGVQAFVGRNYPQARHYFTVYGRDYPGRAVISALAMTYLAEAIEIQQALIEQGDLKLPAFYYPVLLDATVLTQTQADSHTVKRGSADHGARQKKQLQILVEQAVKHLQKAIDLQPDYRNSYLLQASAYLLSNNTFMVRGVLQGRYLKRFSRDASVDLLLAMTLAIEGNHKQAQNQFQLLLKQLSELKNRPENQSALPLNLLMYSAYYNSGANANFLGQTSSSQVNWKQLADQANTMGKPLLFRLALSQLRPDSHNLSHSLENALTVDGYRLNDALKSHRQLQNSELWIEGDKFIVSRNQIGSHYIVSEQGKVINAWQDSNGSIENLLSIGDSPDRPLKTLGLPDRHLHMLSGEYLAYDHYGLALHINQNQVQGWFLY